MMVIVNVFFSGLCFSNTVKAETTEVSTAEEFKEVLARLNTDGGSETVVLLEDISLPGNSGIQLDKGEFTVLGEGHKLTATCVIKGSAVLNLGKEGYSGTLQMVPGNSSTGVLDVYNTSVLNIYDGVTIGPASPIGMAGGIQAHNTSTVNMYGGTIADCSSHAVAGGVYLDGNAVFNMYGGTIKGCTGVMGGAVGLSGGNPIGGSGEGRAAFRMNGGTIENCTDSYIGGGAINAYTAYPISITINGGTIKDCKSTSYGYGGAITLYTTSDTSFQMNGGSIINSVCGGNGYGGAVFILCRSTNNIQFNSGTIKDNSAKIGGGLMIFSGNVTIADGFSLHNNTASVAGDDIYNNGTSVNLGAVDSSATLESCGHKITGWYKDAEARWSYKPCTEEEDHLELFTHTGEVCAEEYGLKAAHGELLYTVTWVNEDGTVLEKDENVPHGSDPSYDGETPTKEATEQYTYTFKGWDKEFSPVTEDITYTATYESTLRTYTVTWKNEDGKTLETDENVPYGSDPNYDGSEPTKAATDKYTYEFDGWEPEISPVKGNVTYTAKFKAIPVPEPEPTPDPEPEPTPEPDPTPEPTPEPEPDPEPTPAPTPTPTPTPTPAPAPTPSPSPRPTPSPTPTPSPEPDPEPTPEPDPTPEPTPDPDPVIIPDPNTPETDPVKYWALINLIAAVITVLTSLGMVLTYFRQDDRDERKRSKFLGLLLAILSVIIFLLTEDMRNRIRLTDRFTWIMIVIVLLNFLLAFFTRNKFSDEEEEEEDPA